MNGQIRFSSEHSLESLIKLAREWKDGPIKDVIKFLAVRSCGTHQFSVVFAIDCGASKASYDSIIYNITDKLKRSFGNEANWDITSEYWQIID